MVPVGSRHLNITMTGLVSIDVLRELKHSFMASKLLLGSGTVHGMARNVRDHRCGCGFCGQPRLHMDFIAETQKRGVRFRYQDRSAPEVITAWRGRVGFSSRVFPC